MESKMNGMTGDAEVIGLIVSEMKRRDKNKLIGKTIVQKMMYLLGAERDIDFRHSLYHYGPYSRVVAGDLDHSEALGIVNIDWGDQKGNDITVGDNYNEEAVDPELKKVVSDMVDRYIEFDAADMSLIATAHYLRERYNVPDEDLVKNVHDIKPKYPPERIERVLKKSGTISF